MTRLTHRNKKSYGEEVPASETIKSSKFKHESEEGSHVLLPLICFRIINIFFVRTAFVPDEYWQALEVAHNSVFGYGYLTWEWEHGLRSYAYPAVFATAYKVLEIFGLDSAMAIVYAPRVMQACLSAVGDWYLYRFMNMHFGNDVARLGLFSNLCSWFWWFCSTRTIINTLETNLLCIGLYYYPWYRNDVSPRKTVIYQITAILICVIRPTAAVVWIPLAVWHIFKERRAFVFSSYVLLSLSILIVSTVIDQFYYGEWVFVHWNFFTFNVLKNMGVHYGSHPWHWYLTQGVPVVLTTQMAFFAHGIISSIKKHTQCNFQICKCLLAVSCLTVFVYSCLGHKEFRFILHIVPIASVFCGISLSTFSEKGRNCALIFLLVTNIPISLYTGLIHQGGTLSITHKLSSSIMKACSPHCPGGVLYLLPCHTTPLYSHLHFNVSTSFLTCLPNLSGEQGYIDEADRFYLDPVSWLDSNIFAQKADVRNTINPHWIVLFDELYEKLQTYKPLEHYEICETSFHTHVPEGKIGSYIHVLCHKP